MDLSLFTTQGATLFSIYLACALGIPVPEEITLISAGVLAATGQLPAVIAAGAGLLGIFTCDWTLYLLGRHLGPRVFRLPFLRSLFTESRIQWASAHVKKNGILICFVARFLPGMRVAIFSTAGAFGVKLYVFFPVDVLAACTVVTLWVSLGNWMGAHLLDAAAYAHEIKVIMISTGLLILCGNIAWQIITRWRTAPTQSSRD